MRLYKGRAQAVAATSPHTLYDPQLASFSMEGFDVTAARGFIDLFGLPMKVASRCAAGSAHGSRRYTHKGGFNRQRQLEPVIEPAHAFPGGAMSRVLRALCLVLLVANTAFAAEFHVKTDGAPTGDGSPDRPLDLQTAMGGGKVKPGDILWLHGGTYRGGFACRVKGTADAPIIIRAIPSHRVTIDCRPRDAKDSGQFTVDGSHLILRDIEFTCSDPQRITQNTGSFPQDIRRGGLTINGSNVKVVNCIIHDCFNGVGFWSGGEGGEIAGCIIYNNGWKAPDRGHGHAIYTQNKTGTKRIIDNIIFNQFSYGIHAYGSSRAFLRGFHIEGNAIFNNGLPGGSRTPAILVGGGSAAERVVVKDNYIYGSVNLGYDPKVANVDPGVTDNYIVGNIATQKWDKLISRPTRSSIRIRPSGKRDPSEPASLFGRTRTSPAAPTSSSSTGPTPTRSM